MVRFVGGSASDPNRVADRPDIQKGKRAIEKSLLVKIKDVDEAGIWRGQTGPVHRVKGPNIWVKTPDGIAGPFTSAVLEPSPQTNLFT